MYGPLSEKLAVELAGIRDAGLYKRERVITSPQAANIRTNGAEVLNFCANNYLGLADDARLIAAAKRGLDEHGYGMASVRFICGTQDVHKALEAAISTFLRTEDTILYSSCFDANGGLFETLLGEEDAVISDALNHASIIDGIRLCKAKRYRYANSDLADLESKLQEADAAGARIKLISTDGVFSMDGTIAKLDGVCALAAKYNALVHVDDSHATGFLGPTGRGSIEHCDVMSQVDVVTSTLGKALGGASGGFTSGRKEIIEILRQRSRPYLFSNTLAPCIAEASIEALRILSASTALRDRLASNTARFRAAMNGLGFTIPASVHPICPVMIGDAALASRMADRMLVLGIYVVGFSFPVVPKGQARIRVQLSAAHSDEQIDRAVAAFAAAGRECGVIS